MDIWLDDERDPKDHGRGDWTWAKTAEALIALLAENGMATVRLSLDHDLGGVGEECMTGYDVLLWVEQQVVNGAAPPMSVMLHTQNPVGRERMKAALQSIHKWAWVWRKTRASSTHPASP